MPENLGEMPALPVAFSTGLCLDADVRSNFDPGFYARVGQRAICHDWKQNRNKPVLIPFSFPWHISCLQPPQDSQSLPCPLKMGLWWMVHAEKQVCQEKHLKVLH